MLHRLMLEQWQCHHHPSLNKLDCQVQASSHNERTQAVVLTRAQCGLEPGFLTMFCGKARSFLCHFVHVFRKEVPLGN